MPDSVTPDRAESDRAPTRATPLRLLVVMPSWLGDAVMATPALRLLRTHLRGSFIGALVRPGLDELLAGSDLIDEFHVERARGVMGPKLVASRIRPRRYDAALLLTNSFSTALITRLAFIPRRVGYDRDGRGLLLTQRLKPALRHAGLGRGKYALVSAVDYYLHAAGAFLGLPEGDGQAGAGTARMSLGVTADQRCAARDILSKAGLSSGEDYALLNPGANNPLKRWPAERFVLAGHWLGARGLRVLVNGSPDERELAESVAAGVNAKTGARPAVALPGLGMSIGALKGIVAGVGAQGASGMGSCRVMLTNDTGPRHVAAAFGIPAVTLFGPTDPRWTTLPPGQHRFENVVADPGLPESEVADDHPDRCAIDRISVERVIEALSRALS